MHLSLFINFFNVYMCIEFQSLDFNRFVELDQGERTDCYPYSVHPEVMCQRCADWEWRNWNEPEKQ